MVLKQADWIRLPGEYLIGRPGQLMGPAGITPQRGVAWTNAPYSGIPEHTDRDDSGTVSIVVHGVI